MKHYLLKKPNYKPATEFYLWKILAQGLIARLKRINITPESILVIGPASDLTKYLQLTYPKANIKVVIDAWEFSKKHYDVVIINAVLGWFNAPAALIEDVYSALNANGLLMLSTLGPATLNGLQMAAVKMGWQPRVDALVDMHHWGDCLLKAGFSDPVMDREDVNICFSNPRDWFKDWRGLGLQDPSEAACQALITSKAWQTYLDLVHLEKHQPWEALFECLFGHAYKPAVEKQKVTEEGVVISLDALKKTLSSQV